MSPRPPKKNTPVARGRDTAPNATDFPMVLQIPHSPFRIPHFTFSIAHSPFKKAFSLIEVVLAIGIVSFALLTIIGLFGGMMKSSGDNTQRREMTEAVDSLRAYLNATNFASAYDWTKNGQELLYLTYKTGSNGTPDPNSQTVAGIWTNADATDLDIYEPARSGRWLRAKLSVSPSNPGSTNLPALSSYTRATLFVQADIFPVAGPGQIVTNASPLQSTIAVQR